ncbi:MAG: hypothetical protein JXR70_17115 [Spirochaetales bacterium]|nr:hypothetical protein [Spirochaetales bacterium]
MKNKKPFSFGIFFGYSILLMLSVMFLISCPEPIRLADYNVIMDSLAPRLEIFSPKADSVCGDIVEVRGKVLDYSTDKDDPGRLKSLSYEVPQSVVSGRINPGEDGSFTFRFLTTTLASKFTLHMKAMDSNNNTIVMGIPLQRIIGNGIPSFRVIPGNKQVRLEWDPVPGASQYTLFYSINNDFPNELNGDNFKNVSSPFILSDLKNGSLYRFLLTSSWNQGTPECRSTYQKAIPLSPFTLSPIVTGGDRQNKIEWKPIEGFDQFEVWKASEADGAYRNFFGTIEGQWFIDKEVESNQWAYYKVKPAMAEAVMSHYNGVASDFFFKETPAYVTQFPAKNLMSDIKVVGSLAFVANSDAGVKILDISNPSSPLLVNPSGTGETAGSAFSLKVSDGFAYVAASEAGLQVINVQNPSSPIVYAAVSTSIQNQGQELAGLARDVEIRNDYAFVADFNTGLHVFNIQNPETPVYVGGSHDFEYLLDIALYGDYIFGTTYYDGLKIIDIHDPENPEPLTSYDDFEELAHIEIRDQYAYLIDRKYGLRILDISSPEKPVLIGSLEIPEGLFNLHLENDFAYLISPNYGLYIADIHYPDTPVLSGSHKISGSKWAVDISGEYAFVASSVVGLWVMRIENIATPQLANIVPLRNIIALEVSEKYAYLLSADSFTIMTMADQEKPDIVKEFQEFTDAVDFCLNGPYAFVIDNSTGLHVIDLHDPLRPVMLASIENNLVVSPGSKITIYAAYVYVLNGTQLYIFDINDPTKPEALLPIQLVSLSKDIYIKNNFLFVVNEYQTGIQIYSLENPADPVLMGRLPISGYTYQITVEDNYAFIASEDKEDFIVVDISNPDNPVKVASCDLPQAVFKIIVRGKYAYVLGRSGSFYVINILDPTHPVKVRDLAMPGCPYAMDLWGPYVYSLTNNQLRIISLNNRNY